MSTSIRSAGPGDAAFLNEVVMSASRSHVERGVWDMFVEDDAERTRFVENLLLSERPHWCHHSGFLVAEIDGRPAAALSGYPADGSGLIGIGEAIKRAAQGLGWSDDEVSAGFARMAIFMNCHMKDEPGSWIVEWVGTDPGFRRRGLVNALLARIFERGRERGNAVCQLMLLIGNDAAQRAYEKVGFRCVEEKRDDEFEAEFGTPGLLRMLCPLVEG